MMGGFEARPFEARKLAPQDKRFCSSHLNHREPTETARTGEPRPGRVAESRVQFTETALQAAATALYCVEPAPYRSLAAFSDAVRAPE